MGPLNKPITRRHCVVALAGASLASGPIAAAAQAAPRIEWPALTLITGEDVVASRWQGVPMVVVFWATWCAYCRRHNAHVDQLYRTVDANRLAVLGVVLDGDAAGARRYMSAANFSFPVVPDGGRLRQRFTSRRMIPMTCTVDATGHLQQCIPGEMSESDVLELARLARPAGKM
jgi:thiol-disulfide isomerase/thioredoxin